MLSLLLHNVEAINMEQHLSTILGSGAKENTKNLLDLTASHDPITFNFGPNHELLMSTNHQQSGFAEGGVHQPAPNNLKIRNLVEGGPEGCAAVAKGASAPIAGTFTSACYNGPVAVG